MSDSAAVFERIRAEDQKLWVPGQGEIDPRISAAQRVVREYDERLELARHEVTGDWVVFIKLGPDNIYPVIGLGPELPSNAEDLRQRLWQADTRVHGDKILKQINEHNRRLQEASRKKALEIDEEVAEHLLWGFRREGVVSPQVFIPRAL